MIKIARRVFFLSCLVVAVWVWFKSYIGPFRPVNLSHDIVELKYAQLQIPGNTAASCSGFTGVCDFPKEGLRLKVSFDGVSWEKPSYIFINPWGGGTGLKWYRTYYGRRHLQLINKTGYILADYSQIIWNSAEYGDLGSLVAFNSTRRIVFVAYHPFGFTGMLQDQGYAHAYTDLI